MKFEYKVTIEPHDKSMTLGELMEKIEEIRKLFPKNKFGCEIELHWISER